MRSLLRKTKEAHRFIQTAPYDTITLLFIINSLPGTKSISLVFIRILEKLMAN
ncbi:MAG: hypothetical protein ACHQF0_00075 [Chitinophagales bacterium]